jgi:Ras-related protein Rab-18
VLRGKSAIPLLVLQAQMPTVGVDFKLVTMTVDGRRCRVSAWDTAGSERFRSLSANFYRGAKGVMMVYDMTRGESFEHLQVWLDEVDRHCGGQGVVKLVVGAKLDLAADGRRVVSREDGAAWARAHEALFVETSAKANEGVREAFHELIQKILDSPKLLEGTAPGPARPGAVSLDRRPGDEPASAPGAGAGGGGCC